MTDQNPIQVAVDNGINGDLNGVLVGHDVNLH